MRPLGVDVVALIHSDYAGLLAHCLVCVGDARGAQRLRDAAYWQLAVLEATDRRTAPMVAALMILRRDREDADAAQGSLSEAIGVLRSCSGPFADDAGPVLDAADELLRRGDVAGATLLLKWVARLNPRLDRVRAAFVIALGLRYSRRRGNASGYGGVSVVAALRASARDVTHGHPGVPTAARAEFLSLVYPRAESVVDGWPRQCHVRSVLVSHRHGRRQLPPRSQLGQRSALDLGPDLGSWHRRSTDSGQHCHLVVSASKASAHEQAATERLERAVNRDRCLCWRADQLYGAAAVASLKRHLQTISLPQAMERLSRKYPRHQLLVAGCGQTGAAWLRVVTSEEGSFYLVRTTLGDDRGWTREEAGVDSDLSTGLYL